MTISATFDHRLVDGGDSGRSLVQLERHLEVPTLGLLSSLARANVSGGPPVR